MFYKFYNIFKAIFLYYKYFTLSLFRSNKNNTDEIRNYSYRRRAFNGSENSG